MSFKKTLLAIALALPFTTALADTQVTLYGAVDGAIHVNKSKGSDTIVEFSDGVAGGSIWGITGEEDLGNGYSVGFTLENAFSLDDGATGEPGLAFSKQATLNVVGGFGELAVGRMGGLASYEGTYSIWDASPFGTDYLQASLGNVFVTGQINNNSILYATPEFGGAKVYFQYSNGTSEDTNKFSKNNHYYGLGLTYEIGSLNLAAIVERFDYKAEEDVKSSMVYSLSAAYDFEVAKVYFGYQYANKFHEVDQLEGWMVGGKGMNQNAFTLGTEVGLGAGTVKAAINYGFGKIKSMDSITADEGETAYVSERDKFDRLSMGVAYEYPLSKRTMVYGWGAWQKGGKAFKQEDVRGDFENWSLGLGMRHEF